jgi:hypothetical protein
LLWETCTHKQLPDSKPITNGASCTLSKEIPRLLDMIAEFRGHAMIHRVAISPRLSFSQLNSDKDVVTPRHDTKALRGENYFGCSCEAKHKLARPESAYRGPHIGQMLIDFANNFIKARDSAELDLRMKSRPKRLIYAFDRAHKNRAG